MTQKASVIDVVRLVTGCALKNATQVWQRVSHGFLTKCEKLRVNGKGRETPVADAPTLVEIIWELPGRAAKEFRRQSAHFPLD